MKKQTFKPIAMHCNKEQLESVKDVFLEEGIRVEDITNDWETYIYLVNNYTNRPNTVTNIHITCSTDYNRTVFKEWNKNTFLEYCGIQVLPEKWAIGTCEEVGSWLNKNSDMPVEDRADNYATVTHWDYFVYPSYNGKSHMYTSVPKGYTEITIEQFREIAKNHKPMSQQKLTVPISEVLEIHKIACQTWKSIIGKYLSRVDEHQMITFTQEEIDKMFLAATSEQTPVLIRIFGEKVEIDYDKIKTGSKVMLRYTGQHILGKEEVDFDKPFDVVFFKSPWTIREKGKFKRGSYASSCSFHQDSNYVVFASNANLDYIASVIEY